MTQQERNRRISEGLRLAWKRRKGKAMQCLTCNGPMGGIGHGMFHCGRCGCLKLPDGTSGDFVVPADAIERYAPAKYIGTAQILTCPGQFLKDGRWVCTESCRKELCHEQSMDDLAASGGIVDAP